MIECYVVVVVAGAVDDGVVVVSSYEKVRNVTDPLLVVVLDTEDSSFGTFCTARKLKPTSKFVGTGMLIQSSNHCMTAALFPLFLDCEKVQVDRMRVGNDFRAQESWWIGVR